jgi:hypothetical protein
MAELLPVPADGHAAIWASWDGAHREELTLRWDNEAWTAVGRLGRERAEYVLRLSPTWQVRQFLLFRDLDEPDLWLGTDGRGRWGEVNGAHRTELDGATDVAVEGTPFPHTVPVRRLPLRVGDAADVVAVTIDVETLGVVPAPLNYERVADRRWRVRETVDDVASLVAFDVDDHGGQKPASIS